MPSPRGAWISVTLNFAGTSTGYAEAVPGVVGTIKQITAGTMVKPTAGTLAIAKNGVNILAATNLDLSGVTNGTAANQGLSTDATALRVDAASVLKATWTLGTAGSFVAGACTVWIEPDVW